MKVHISVNHNIKKISREGPNPYKPPLTPMNHYDALKAGSVLPTMGLLLDTVLDMSLLAY